MAAMTSIRGDWSRALDAVLFSQSVGIKPDPWQAEVLRSPKPRLLLNCSRQSGKSSTAATLAIHTAIYRPGSLTLMVSPTQRQSGELFRKALSIYRSYDKTFDLNADSESALQLEIQNGSRIAALPGKEGSIRSFSNVGLLLLDEAARIPDELYLSVLPMLAVSRGRMIAMSTPFGTRGWWYEAWRNTDEPWERYEIPAAECPRIAPEFLAEMREKMGDWWYEQEFNCRFMDAQSSAFRSEDIEAAVQEYDTWDL